MPLWSFEQFVTKKKPSLPVSPGLRAYLTEYARAVELPVSYARLCNWAETVPLFDTQGQDTLWQTVIYAPEEMREMSRYLTRLYAQLKTEGDASHTDHLYIDRVDYCSFGNSNPFRIRVVNARNENQDYYYIKRADASRVYGLELEHLLSPNRMHYLVDGVSLVEEHVVGIPGDIFIGQWMHDPHIKQVRLAKELVKFNERCFVRLLGDMRAYNFVVDVTPDFEEVQIRIRSMDFDQQSYSGRKNFYLPQFFKENYPLVEFCLRHLDSTTARQYQREEQTLIYRRSLLIRERLGRLLTCMRTDELAPPEKVVALRDGLAQHYGNSRFHLCRSMGEILTESLEQLQRSLHGQNPAPALFMPE